MCEGFVLSEMPIGDPQDGFFYPNLTLMINSYNIYPSDLIQGAYDSSLYIPRGHRTFDRGSYASGKCQGNLKIFKVRDLSGNFMLCQGKMNVC